MLKYKQPRHSQEVFNRFSIYHVVGVVEKNQLLINRDYAIQKRIIFGTILFCKNDPAVNESWTSRAYTSGVRA